MPISDDEGIYLIVKESGSLDAVAVPTAKIRYAKITSRRRVMKKRGSSQQSNQQDQADKKLVKIDYAPQPSQGNRGENKQPDSQILLKLAQRIRSNYDFNDPRIREAHQ